MPSEITWLPSASKDVFRLRAFLKSKNPVAAQRAAQRILEGVRMLEDNPGAGAPVEDLSGYRDLKLPFGSGEYIIRYREESRRVLIVKVRHSKEEDF
ncbi:MAG: plasmid stabilization system [Alteromonadaceae bacterium]|nr:MAG: plasmid stabilization system [Alteromonadaceae bacterium]